MITKVQFSKSSFEFQSNMNSFDIKRESSVYFTTFICLVKKKSFTDIRKIMPKKFIISVYRLLFNQPRNIY